MNSDPHLSQIDNGVPHSGQPTICLRSTTAIRIGLTFLTIGSIGGGGFGVLSSLGQLPEPIFGTSYDWMLATISVFMLWLTRNVFRMRFELDSQGIRNRGFRGRVTVRRHDQIRGVYRKGSAGSVITADDRQFVIFDLQGAMIANLSPNWLARFDAVLPWVSQLNQLTTEDLTTLRSRVR